MTLFGGSRVNTRSTRYELCSISVSHCHCLRDFKPTKCKKPVHLQPPSLSSAVQLNVDCMFAYILFNIKQLVHQIPYSQLYYTKALHTKWYKMFSLDVPKFFERCTKYMKYISLSSLYFYPRDMHLEEICHLLEQHCNLQRMPKSGYLFLIQFIFSSDLLKQLAVALCNQQNYRI